MIYTFQNFEGVQFTDPTIKQINVNMDVDTNETTCYVIFHEQEGFTGNPAVNVPNIDINAGELVTQVWASLNANFLV